MDELDVQIGQLVAVLAQIVNRAGRTEATSTAVTVNKVPTALLDKARRLLGWWQGGEYGTDDVRQACDRLLS